MQKGAEGFENVTAINTPLMEGMFVFGRQDASVASDAIIEWNDMYSPDISRTVITDTRPVALHLLSDSYGFDELMRLRKANEPKVKLMSIIRREREKFLAQHDDHIKTLDILLADLNNSSIHYDALLTVKMLYRASRRTIEPDDIDPIIVAEKIIELADNETQRDWH